MSAKRYSESMVNASNLKYHLGCPLWACKEWVGDFFTEDARREDYLFQYGSIFNTVEGNTTFYGLPTSATVERWASEAPKGFKFCFKFPRSISHVRRLINASEETIDFFHVLEPLGDLDMLGPFFLQMSSKFGGHGLKQLQDYLKSLPSGFSYAVEVRHKHYFDKGKYENALNETLVGLGIDRVLFDTSDLQSADGGDETTIAAQQSKPRVPYRTMAIGKRPFLRFVGQNQVVKSKKAIRKWAALVADWIHQGLDPYIFMHTPRDFFAPQLCLLFHDELSSFTQAGLLSEWPYVDSKNLKTGSSIQLKLFE